MTSWKIKNKNNKNNKNNNKPIINLKTIHKNILLDFNEKKKNIEYYKIKTNELKNQQNDLMKKYNISCDEERTKMDKKLIEIEHEINNYTDLINGIEKNKYEINYYNSTFDILFDYYDNNDESEYKIDSKQIKNNTTNEKTILDFLTNTNKQCTERIVKNKAKICNEYLNITNENYNYKKNTSMFCDKCNINKVHIEDFIICNVCGEIDNFIMENEQNNNKTINGIKQKYPYKRLNHLTEWLNQFQAKELTNVPNEVCNKIIDEINKMKINNIEQITYKKIKSLLKQLKFQQYYEHIPNIMSKITKNHPPLLSRNTEEQIKKMFKLIQKPFEQHCPNNRTNFLSYSYVLHKIFQLLDLKQYKNFSLLKSRDKLRMQDDIWKLICKDLNWNFIPSV